jgi:hypothetical protein
MKPRPERTKTETKAEKGAETRTGPLAVGSSGLCESYVAPRASFLYSVAAFHSPLQTQHDHSRPPSPDIPPLALNFRDLSAQKAVLSTNKV